MDDAVREKQINRVTLIGSFVNFLLLAFKFVAGIVGHSAAMIADAVHSLSDFVTDVIVLVFVHVSNKPQDDDHDYGHGKYETFATLAIGVILFGVGLGIGYNALERIWGVLFRDDSPESPSFLALLAAFLSILLKELLYRYTMYVSNKVDSPAVAANALHHRSDALSSLGTFMGIGGAILLGDKWVILDPIAAVVVSLFILKLGFDVIRQSFGELTEQSLSEEEEQQILSIICSFKGVVEPHHLRTRRIGNKKAIEVHIRMNGNLPLSIAHDTSMAIEKKLRIEFGDNTHIGLHVEPIKE